MLFLIAPSARTLSGTPLDQLRDFFEHLSFVAPQAPFRHIATIELGHAPFGDIKAQQAQEVIAERGIIAFDFVDGKYQEVTGCQLTGRHIFGLGALESLRIDVRPASRAAVALADTRAFDG